MTRSYACVGRGTSAHGQIACLPRDIFLKQSMKYEQTRYEVAVANRIMAALGLASGLTASVGHASKRVPEAPDTFLIKGRGYELDILSELGPDDMVLCDLEGNKLEAPEGVSQCYEVKMHSCIYRA